MHPTMKFLISTIILLPIFVYASAGEQVYQGIYVWGPETHIFKACNQKKSFWVSFDWAGIEMHEFYKSNQKKAYQHMYIEFRGQVLNEIVDGFAEKYSGLMRISEVKEYTFEIPISCKL